MHIYDWLNLKSDDVGEIKAREWLNYFTLDVVYKQKNKIAEPNFDVYCMYKGKLYKIMGASRLGDVWLSINHSRRAGYDLRVDIEECSKFDYEKRR